MLLCAAWRLAGGFSLSCKDSIMGKGNNSQQNDKKKKKPKQSAAKKPDAKAGRK